MKKSEIATLTKLIRIRKSRPAQNSDFTDAEFRRMRRIWTSYPREEITRVMRGIARKEK